MAQISTQTFSLKTRKPVKVALEDDDMLGEDDLLTEEDRKVKVPGTIDDCRTKKKACANCTCGRAEEEQKERADADAGAKAQPAAPKEKVVLKAGDDMPFMGCGSCTKGDAFRCASCPFLGQPSFQEGANGKVQLDLSDDL